MKFNLQPKKPYKKLGKKNPKINSSTNLWAFSALFMLLCSFAGQAQNITINFKNAPLETVLTEVAKQANYEAFYTQNLLKNSSPVTINVKNSPLKETLNLIFNNQNLKYTITNQTIVVTPLRGEDLGNGVTDVRGKVLNNKNEPFPGINVYVQGTNKHAITDFDGSFTLYDVPNNGTIECSGLTIEKTLFPINGRNLMTLIVVEKTSEMKEIVVTGYQNIARSRFTGAITKIDEKTLNENINTSLSTALEGRVAGLMFQKNVTGSDADKPILRGMGTFSPTVGYAPLLVIDGLPTELTLEDINPYDIESVNVLKDAAAASIYGSRAANGIIVLTTKKGNGNLKVSINSDFFISTKPNLRDMNYASTSDIIDFEQNVYDKERARFANTATMFSSYGDIGSSNPKYYSPLYQLNRNLEDGKISNADYSNADYSNTIAQWRKNDYYKDYRDNVWQNELRQRYNVAFSGSSAKQNTYVSFNYDQAKGRIINNDSRAFNLYAKTSFQVKDWLNATIGLNATYSNDDATDGDFGNYDIQKRYERITDDNGNRVLSSFVGIKDGFTSSSVINPAMAEKIAALSGFKPITFNVLNALDEGIVHQNSLSVRAFANLKAKIWRGLSASSQFQYESKRNENESYYDVNSYKMRYAINALTGYNATTNAYTNVEGVSTGGRFKQISSQVNNYSFRNQLDFNQDFDGGRHYVSAIAGFEMRETYVPKTVEQLRYGYDPVTLSSAVLNSLALSQTGVSSYIYGNNQTLAAGTRTQKEVLHRYFSVFSTLGYTFLSKYNVTGSYRVDRADLFGVDPKYKNRPLWSAGLGWNISNENFMKGIEWVSALKLRATYGVNGNIDQSTTPYVTATRKNDNLYQSLQYTSITDQPNPMLRWEKTQTTNFGIDYSLFLSKLRGSIDIYNKYSTDLLATTDLDPTVGALSRRINAGALLNRGIEFSVGSDWYNNGNFHVSSNVVLAFNKTTVKKVTRAQSSASVYVSSPIDYFLENEGYNSLYAYKYGGTVNGYPYVLDENGNPSITFDANGNPVASSIKIINNTAALVNKGSLIPTYTGSLSQRFSYRQFDLNLLFVFSGGNVMRKETLDMSTDAVNLSGITDRYTDTNQNGNTRLYVDFADNLRNTSYAGTISSQWRNSDVNVVDGDYVKLRNISLGYNLPKSFANRIKMSSAKFTFQANNLWYWSAAGNHIDPEVYSANSGTRNLPLPVTYLFGFNLTL
ncbi:SusC/RagA family TonB-linked outer membrane protein [Flavobacterium sp. ANB]|uniref:SusC/RagA family TonB-linked outer membrane protein n=1 Tax=unclassified Flavobacterium TaxID=196869 RepID=UPI0012B75143|nr:MULTISPECIES: SusC/RagA family TonB-linked outer membrane protein [unclassified Flavobacterium]MBF4516131.1 SusC/RagA family TonB-linked outer membrane protein [Flavobacterium sp. ANB]MTD72449.1 SusC/RagA family TonB-linked outer membrane protein [Flavobacterium sp. LC2016-13]